MGYRIPRKVEDDRGVTHAVTQARRHALWPMPWHEGYRRTPLIWRICLLSFLTGAIFMVLTPITPGALFGQIRGAMACFVMPTAAIAFLVTFERYMKPWSKAQQFDPTRCHACDYNLEALTPDPDGCITCPECGAAWKLPTSTPDA